MKKFIEILWQSIVILFMVGIFFVMPIWCIVSCESQHRKEHSEYIKEANKKPELYEIVYTDGYKDTIKVYKDTFETIRATNFWGDKTDICVRYLPYKKYSENECLHTNYAALYNVLRTKKL